MSVHWTKDNARFLGAIVVFKPFSLAAGHTVGGHGDVACSCLPWGCSARPAWKGQFEDNRW